MFAKETVLKLFMVMDMHMNRRIYQFISSCRRVLMGIKNVRSKYAFINVLSVICITEKRGECPLCGYRGLDIYGHMYKSHGNVVDAICEDLYYVKTRIDTYIKVLKGNYLNKYRCLVCGYQSFSKEEMYRHMILNHFFDDVCKEYIFIFDCNRLALSRGL